MSYLVTSYTETDDLYLKLAVENKHTVCVWPNMKFPYSLAIRDFHAPSEDYALNALHLQDKEAFFEHFIARCSDSGVYVACNRLLHAVECLGNDERIKLSLYKRIPSEALMKFIASGSGIRPFLIDTRLPDTAFVLILNRVIA